MSSRRALLAILLLAGALRVIGLEWGHNPGFHPDERRIAFALDELSFRPLQLNPHFFAYGSFPLYVQKAWLGLVRPVCSGCDDFHIRIVAVRALSVLVGVGTVAVLAQLGARVAGGTVGLLAALLLALAVLPIQHAHFITVDLYQAALVLVVLERLVAFVRSQRRRTFLVAAIATGLSLATKVSSLPLLLPLVIAPWFRPEVGEGARGRLRKLGLGVLGIVVAAAAFAATEPYAIIDHTAFLHDIREQNQMVRNPGGVPYTLQYVGTRPYVDDLRQAFTWGMGPLLGFAAGAGTILALVRLGRRRSADDVLIASFFLPYLLITGSFPIKFMRYLLPLYPVWCLYAAQWLTSLRRSDFMRRATTAIVVAATAAYALAFVSIYLRPHPWLTASRWMYRELPPGSLILTSHWDDSLPIDLEGLSRGTFRFVELPFFEADGAQKTAALAANLADGDALVFPTKRMYGSISKAPDRYPETTRLLELLFAEDLGYHLDRVFASRPALLGVTLDDDDADESFSVYDHPKVVVFRNSEKLSTAEIERRLRARIPSRRIGRSQMVYADATKPPAPEEAPHGWIESSLAALLCWSIGLAWLGFVGGRLLGSLVPALPHAAIAGLGPTVGYLTLAYLSWLAAAGFGVPFSNITVVALAVLLSLACRRLRAIPSDIGTLVFGAAFAFFVAVRAANPEIFWGEKPMDFAFLSSIYRATAMPPPEPWMSGRTINYPYFGHFAVAALGKLTGVAPALAFNLGIATIGALAAAAAYGAGVAFTGSRRGGVIAALLVAAAGNLDGPIEYAARRRIDFDYFWATSRVIRDTINEFPLWSFLFADLHAHVMALPLALLEVALLGAWFAAPTSGGAGILGLSSLVLGAIATTNTWSWPVYGGLFVATAAFAVMLDRRAWPRFFFAAIAVAFSAVWFLPYWTRFVAPPANWGWEHASAPLSGVLVIFGGFLAVLLARVSRALRPPSTGARSVLSAIAAVAVLTITARYSMRAGFALLAAFAFVAAWQEEARSARFTLLLASAAALLGALADTVYAWDRMNTIFKSYMEMWVWFALGAAFWIVRAAEAPPSRLRRVAFAAGAVLATASAFTAVTDVVATLRTVRVPGPRPTLDGTAYLATYRPNDAKAIDWLNHNVAGSAFLLEAQGPSYQEFSRVSMNTGLPTVLGWDYHLFQRAHSWAEIDSRKADVAALFSSTDGELVDRLLAKYRIGLVYVGSLERNGYAPEGIEKFRSWSDRFQLVYANPGVEIFAVPAYFHWSETRPFIEAPSVAAAAEPEAPGGVLSEPRGVTVDVQGNVWVADFGHRRIQRFDRGLHFLAAFGGKGDGEGQFNDPCDLAVGPDRRVYVADTWNHRIQVFDAEGRFLRQWTAEFFGPRGIDVAADGSVYVTDTGNGRIAKFTARGDLVTRFGKKGAGPGELDEPIGIAVGGDGTIYVADTRNRRVAVFSADGSPLAAWPVPGWQGDRIIEPYLAVLPDGRVVVSDPPGDRLLFYDREGRITGEARTTPGGNPTGLAVRPDGTIVVTELRANRLLLVTPP